MLCILLITIYFLPNNFNPRRDGDGAETLRVSVLLDAAASFKGEIMTSIEDTASMTLTLAELGAISVSVIGPVGDDSSRAVEVGSVGAF